MTLQYFSEYSGNLAYALVLFSFLVQSMMRLRLLSICGSIAGIIYAYFHASGPLWTPIIWNLLFISVNTWRAASLLWQRRSQTLNAEEQFLSTHALKAFPATELKSFVGLAKRRSFELGEQLIHKGVVLHELFVIVGGTISIELEKREIARLSAGSFLGEMSFLSREAARADANGASAGEILSWTHDDIQSWTAEDPQRGGLLQAALGSQIIELLMNKSAKS